MKILFASPFDYRSLHYLGSNFLQMYSKNNMFPVIVFGELFENLQLSSQLKLRKMIAGGFQ